MDALSVMGVSVNSVPFGIVPNSLKFTEGLGVTKVRASSTGGGGVEPVHTEDAEEKIGKISFDLYVTSQNRKLFKSWKRNRGANFVACEQDGEEPIAGSQMSVANDPEWEATADGTVTIEFEGAPLS